MVDPESSDEIYSSQLFQSTLLSWGINNIQVFPWRYIDDPYKILTSEFMLQRTNAYQVIPIYEKFVSVFPSLLEFSHANHEYIHQILYPLGLVWRIENMESTLIKIAEEFGYIPLNYSELASFHGIGQYIAGATICFSLNKPFVLIDANVVRVVGRVFGLDLRGEARRRKSMVAKVASLVEKTSPRDYYYSIIDLSHILCKPQNPLCLFCPFHNINCVYYRTKWFFNKEK